MKTKKNNESAKSVSHTSRRHFLKVGGTAVAGIALTNNRLFAADTSPKKIRIGIVGGRFGASFQWHEHPDCIVEAVSDLRPERCRHLMETYNCTKSYPNLEKLVKDKNIDAVAVFTEAPNHARHVIECLNHDKHVISAVPACAGGGLAEAEELHTAVKKSGLTYMMAETSYYQQHTISARKFYNENKYGDLYYCESEYQHSGLEVLFFEDNRPTWRHGLPPMLYPTHCTAHLISVSGERLSEVVCHGWGDDDEILKTNIYKNPFWNESALFRTDRGHAFRVNIWWKGAHRGCERAQWIGTKMSFYAAHPNGLGPVIVRPENEHTEKDDAGFERALLVLENYQQPEWWKSNLLPEPLRHNSGHQGSHTFLTHEFIDALTHDRAPAINISEALAYTVPGIVAHQSALQNGQLLKIPQII
jgi:predicted dehydrogenase